MVVGSNCDRQKCGVFVWWHVQRLREVTTLNSLTMETCSCSESHEEDTGVIYEWTRIIFFNFLSHSTQKCVSWVSFNIWQSNTSYVRAGHLKGYSSLVWIFIKYSRDEPLISEKIYRIGSFPVELMIISCFDEPKSQYTRQDVPYQRTVLRNPPFDRLPLLLASLFFLFNRLLQDHILCHLFHPNFRCKNIEAWLSYSNKLFERN